MGMEFDFPTNNGVQVHVRNELYHRPGHTMHAATLQSRPQSAMQISRVVNNTFKKYWQQQYRYTLKKVLSIGLPIQILKKVLQNQILLQYCITNTNILAFTSIDYILLSIVVSAQLKIKERIKNAFYCYVWEVNLRQYESTESKQQRAESHEF